MFASPCDVLAEMELSGVNVRILDYRWSANERIWDRQDLFVLRYRPELAPISLSAHLDDGRVQDFGRVMFFPARTKVETTSAKVTERTRNVMCAFTDQWFRQIWPERPDWSAADLARCYDLRNVRIEQAMRQLGEEVASPGFASQLMAESLTRMIAIDVARHFRPDDRPRRVRTSEGRLSERELGRIYDIIDSASNRTPTTEELSNECGISSAHLRRTFKRTTGVTLHRYVADVRLGKARALLAESDLSLKEIAFKLGFSGPCTFSSTFKKASGETPDGYRQRLRSLS